MNKATRLFDYIDIQCNENYVEKAISYKYDTTWTHFNSKQFKEAVDTYSLAFLAHGIQKGDTIGMVSNNRPEWNFCDNGMMQAGAINVPIYPTSSQNDFEFILNNSEVKMVFVSDANLFNKINQLRDKVPSIREIFSFEKVDGCKHVSEFLSKADESYREQLNEIKSSIHSEDLATLIYTSGTTGNPKGVMLSHRNIIFNIEEVSPHLPVVKNYKVLSFLPLCHVFERVVTYYYFYVGVEVYYAESIEKLKDNISEVQPHFFTCVPRLLEKIYDGLVAKGQEFTGFKKLLYNWAIKVANTSTSKNLSYKIADKLIFSKWREALGNNIIGIVTGAAALQPRLGFFFNNIGIPIREGYGMTETAPVISFNRFEEGNYKYGTVGLLLENVRVKFEHREGMESDEGEILCQGDNVMMGYFKNPQATAETIKDGWLYTGDIGKIVDNKFLKITDRAKELFKTSGGKYVAPQVVENKLKESKYIEQLIVIGNDRKFVSALIFPSIMNLEKWAGYKKLTIDFSTKGWSSHPMILAKLQKEIDKFNVNFNHIEQIKKFQLIENEWTIESGELTPTLKLKRKVIESRYADLIDSIYVD